MAAIRNLLVLSIAHLKPETRWWLDANAEAAVKGRRAYGPNCRQLWCAPTATGYFMRVERRASALAEMLPEQHRYLSAIFARAAALGCDYILFGADGPTDPDLPTYGDLVTQLAA